MQNKLSLSLFLTPKYLNARLHMDIFVSSIAKFLTRQWITIDYTMLIIWCQHIKVAITKIIHFQIQETLEYEALFAAIMIAFVIQFLKTFNNYILSLLKAWLQLIRRSTIVSTCWWRLPLRQQFHKPINYSELFRNCVGCD